VLEVGIPFTLLNWHWQYNIINIHDCLLMGWRQTISSCVCSTAMASPSDSVC